MRGEFEDFLRLREQAEALYVGGDGTSVDSIVPHTGSASLHTLAGETIVGADRVAAYYLAHARDFRGKGTSHFDVIQHGCGGTIGFWTGFQVATVYLRDAVSPQNMRIRVTEVVRRHDDEWKLVHRHADVPSSPRGEKA